MTSFSRANLRPGCKNMSPAAARRSACTGLQLQAIHDCQPAAELFGLDLSTPAIDAAGVALKDLVVDLRAGSIADTPFEDDFCDLVTCNASMSSWQDPQVCFHGIYRILRPGREALLFEPHQDIGITAASEQIRENMRDEGPLRRWGAV